MEALLRLLGTTTTQVVYILLKYCRLEIRDAPPLLHRDKLERAEMAMATVALRDKVE